MSMVVANRRWQAVALPAMGVAVAVLLGSSLARTSGPLLLLAVIGGAGAILIAIRPRLGLLVCYPLFVLLPYDAVRVKLPVFHSPLQIFAIVTLGVAIAHQLIAPRPLPRSRVYLPLALTVTVLGIFALAGHGEVATDRFLRFAQGLWPLPIIVLLVRTPKQARRVLLALVGSVVALALLWLPGLVGLASGSVASAVRVAANETSGESTLSLTLLGAVGGLSYLTLVGMVLIVPVLLGVALLGGSWRWPAFTAFALLSITILLATYAAAVVALLIAVLLTFVVLFFMSAHLRRSKFLRRIVILLPGVIAVFALTFGSSPVQRTLERVQNPSLDISGSTRLSSLSEGWQAFIDRPLIGQGAFDRQVVTARGRYLKSHNSLGVMAYEYGLVLIVPFLWALWELSREHLQSIRTGRSLEEKALALGLLASLGTAVFTALFTPVFGQVVQDTVFWTLAALGIAWRSFEPEPNSAALCH